MSSSNPGTSSPKRRIRNQKNLVYKGKKYVIDFDLLKHYSDAIYNHEEDYKNTNDINIPEELNEVNDSVITLFIKFIHNEHISEDINDSNVLGLRQLCNHYDVPELKEIVEKYISQNPNLVFQTFLLKLTSNQGIQIDTEEEKNVSHNFFDFIDNELMLRIPVPTMYRILNNYDLKMSDLNENESKRLLNFLFKYLRENGKRASALFSTIDIQRSRIELIPTLLNEYSDVFDFNMINPKLGIKTIRELLDEITNLKLNFSTKIEEMNRIINKQREDYSNLSNLLNQQISYQRSNEKRFEQIEARLNGQNGIIEKVNNLETNLIQQNKTIQSNETSLKSKIDSLKAQMESSFNTKFSSHQNLFEQMNANINSIKSELTHEFTIKIDQINRKNCQINNQSFITKDI